MEKIMYFCKSAFAFLVYRFMLLFRIDNKKIVIANYYGLSGYSDNPKYIAKELLGQNRNYKIIWLVRDMTFTFPEGIEKVRFNSIKSLYHLATAKVWVDSQRKPIFVTKRKKQLYIQTWHGCLGMKKIEMDAINSYDNKKRYLRERKHDTKMIDYFMTGAQWFTELVQRAFMYKGEFLPWGIPRNDILINNNLDILKIKETLGIKNNTKIVMYAPTFRNDENSISAFDLDYEKLLAFLKTYYGQEVTLLIRLHPRLRKLSSLISFSENILDVTKYYDIQELLLISDMLITDYSSCIFDFSLQKKPGFIYASDIDEYKNDRNFYFNLLSLPYSVAQTTDELISNIQNFDYTEYKGNLEKYFDSVGLCESGEASKKIIKLINDFTEK